MADKTKIVKGGPVTVTINSTDLSLTNTIVGHNEDGATITFKYGYKEIKTHNSGDTAIASVCNGLLVTLEMKACEFDIADVRKLAFPFASPTSTTFTQALSNVIGKVCKVLDTVRVHLDADGSAETHDWLLNSLELKPDTIKIVSKIGEKWVVDIKGECLYLDTADSFTYGVTVP